MNKITISLLLVITISSTVCYDFLGRDIDHFLSSFKHNGGNTTASQAIVICGIEKQQKTVQALNAEGVALGLHNKSLSLYDNQEELKPSIVHKICHPVLKKTKINDIVKLGKHQERVGIDFSKEHSGLLVQALFIRAEGQPRFGTMIGIGHQIKGETHYIVVGAGFDADKFNEEQKEQLIRDIQEVIPDLKVVD